MRWHVACNYERFGIEGDVSAGGGVVTLFPWRYDTALGVSFSRCYSLRGEGTGVRNAEVATRTGSREEDRRRRGGRATFV
jgi:hypothetical protein